MSTEMHLIPGEEGGVTAAEAHVSKAAKRLRRSGFPLRSFLRDESGSYAVMAAVLMPVVIGAAGLGTEVGLWLYQGQNLQSAVDSGAISAAVAYYQGASSNLETEASAVMATYGVVASDTSGATITVNRPPTSGNYTTTANAVEVIAQRPQTRLFSAYWFPHSFMTSARAVAVAKGGNGCTLSLDHSAAAATKVQGSANVNLIACDLYDNSNDPTALTVGGSATVTTQAVDVVGGVSGASDINAPQGISTGQPVANDPYGDVPMPSFSGCNYTNFSAHSSVTLNPGVYCGGMNLTSTAVVTLNPGVYFIDQGSLQVNGGATLVGNGVTLVFTSSTGSNYATATINGGATVDLTAPTYGPTQGIVMFGDRNMPLDTAFKFNGGASQTLGGAIYIPNGAVSFSGGANTSTGCTQVIGDTITFTGNSNLAINCGGYRTRALGSAAARLVE